MLDRARAWLESAQMPEDEYRRLRDEALGRAPVPVFWLFGKVGSGKSTIVRYLTGAAEAEIGTGFRPKTSRSRRYDFPGPDEPVLRFLDTRGLGEVDYDPREDIESFADSTHVVIVTVRVSDHALDAVVEPLRRIRAAAPERPVVLVLSSLHDAYPGEQHPPYPFDHSLEPPGLDPALARSLTLHRQRFSGLVDSIVPIDLSLPAEGLDPPEYGGERLKEVLLECLPRAYRHTLSTLEETMGTIGDLNARRAAPHVLGASSLAAAAAAVPLPWIDLPVVTAIQSHLLYRLAALYGREVDKEIVLELISVLGARIAIRGLVRGTLKFVPFLGQAANAALAFGTTYALGRTASWYYGEKCRGNAPAREDLERVWGRELGIAERLWKRAESGRTESPPKPASKNEPASQDEKGV